MPGIDGMMSCESHYFLIVLFLFYNCSPMLLVDNEGKKTLKSLSDLYVMFYDQVLFQFRYAVNNELID